MIRKRSGNTMALKEEELSQIGSYVKDHLPEWLTGINLIQYLPDYDRELRERQIRVEEELKNQRELMKQGFDLMEKRFEQMEKRFEQVDKRFEQIDKRFEQVDKRFEQVDKHFEELRTDTNRRFEEVDKRFNRITVLITTGFAMITVLITVFKFISP